MYIRYRDNILLYLLEHLIAMLLYSES